MSINTLNFVIGLLALGLAAFGAVMASAGVFALFMELARSDGERPTVGGVTVAMVTFAGGLALMALALITHNLAMSH